MMLFNRSSLKLNLNFIILSIIKLMSTISMLNYKNSPMLLMIQKNKIVIARLSLLLQKILNLTLEDMSTILFIGKIYPQQIKMEENYQVKIPSLHNKLRNNLDHLINLFKLFLLRLWELREVDGDGLLMIRQPKP